MDAPYPRATFPQAGAFLKALSLLIFTLILLPTSAAQTFAEDENERVQVDDFPLANNNYWVSKAFKAGSTDDIELEITEAQGRIFDVLMMKTVMLDTYERVLQQGGGIQYYESHSKLGGSNLSLDEIMPNTKGQFIFVIDNTEAPDNGGYANSTLNLTFSLKVTEASPGPGIVLSLLVVGVTAMALVRRRND